MLVTHRLPTTLVSSIPTCMHHLNSSMCWLLSGLGTVSIWGWRNLKVLLGMSSQTKVLGNLLFLLFSPCFSHISIRIVRRYLSPSPCHTLPPCPSIFFLSLFCNLKALHIPSRYLMLSSVIDRYSSLGKQKVLSQRKLLLNYHHHCQLYTQSVHTGGWKLPDWGHMKSGGGVCVGGRWRKDFTTLNKRWKS